jgi:hypothetical protein
LRLLLRLLQPAALPQLHLVFQALLWLQRLLRCQYPAGSVEQRLPLVLDSTRLCCRLVMTQLLLILCLISLLLLYTFKVLLLLVLLLSLPQPATYAALAIRGGCTPDVATAASTAVVAALGFYTSCYVQCMRWHRLQ